MQQCNMTPVCATRLLLVSGVSYAKTFGSKEPDIKFYFNKN